MALAAISAGTASGNSKASSSSVTTGVFNATIAADSLVIVVVAKDNVQTTDGQTSEVTSVTDTKSNSYTKVIEFCNGQGGAGSGATVSMWMSVTTTQLTTSDTVTANLSSSVTAKGVFAWGFSKGAGTTISTLGTGTLANDGADPGSLTSSGLSAGTEYLTFRAVALEAVNTAVTATSGWTAVFPTGAATSGGGGASNMAAEGEYKIQTGATSMASDPTITSADCASVIASFYEVASGTQFNQSCLATSSPVAARVNSTGKPLAATTTPTKTLVNQTGKTLASSTSLVAALARSAGKILTTITGSQITTWNPSDKSGNITLSNGNLTTSLSSGILTGSVRATKSIGSSDKVMFAMTVDTQNGDHRIGVAQGSMSLSNFIGGSQGADSVGYAAGGTVLINGSTVATLSSYTVGDIIYVAVDGGAGKIWFRKNNGSWNTSGDPAAGTGAVDISGILGPYYPTWSDADSVNNNGITANFGSTFSGSIPSGFTAMTIPAASLIYGHAYSRSFQGYSQGGPCVWNPSDKDTDIALSNGNLTASYSFVSTIERVRSTDAITGRVKVYWEVHVDSNSFTTWRAGIANASFPANTNLGADTNSISYQTSGQVRYNTTVLATIQTSAVGDTICFAYDRSAGKLWVRTNAGNWNNDAAANPATNTNGVSVSDIGDAYPAWSANGTAGQSGAVTANFGATTFAQSVPSGFVGLNTGTASATMTKAMIWARSLLASTGTNVATLVRQTGKVIQASTSPVTSAVRAVSKALTITTAPVATLVRQTAKILRQTTAPVATLVASHVVPKAIQAITGTNIASLVRSTGKVLQAVTGTNVASLIRSTGKLLLASSSTVASLVRRVNKAFQASTAPVATLIRSTGKALQVSTAPVATLIRSAPRLLTVTTAPVASLVRQVGKVLQVSTSLVATLVRSIGKILQAITNPVATESGVFHPGGTTFNQSANATTSPVATRILSTAKFMTVTASVIASLVRSTGKVLQASATQVASLVTNKINAKTIQAVTGTNIATLVRQVGKVLQASSSPVAVLVRSIGKILQVVTAPVATLVRSTGKILRQNTSPVAAAIAIKVFLRAAQATSTAVASLVRRPNKVLQASTTPLATLLRGISKLLQVATNPLAALARSTGKFLRVTTNPVATASAFKVFLRSAAVSTSPVGSLIRSTTKVLQALTAPVTSMRRVIGKILQAVSTVITTISRLFSGIERAPPDRRVSPGIENRRVAAEPMDRETDLGIESRVIAAGQFESRRIAAEDDDREIDPGEVIRRVAP